MLMHCRANRLVSVLDCQGCGHRLRCSSIRLADELAECLKCGARNPRANLLKVTEEEAEWRRILVCCVPRAGYNIHALALDCRTVLGPWIRVASKETLRRLLVYLGATPQELAHFDQSVRSWGQGSVTITLRPDRKNLLKLRKH